MSSAERAPMKMAPMPEGPDALKDDPRHVGPKALILKGVPCVIWAEDALHHYGVPTVVFDLFCLVEDEISAAQKLEEAGFLRIPEDPIYSYHLPELVKDRPRLRLSQENLTTKKADSTTIVLLRAKSWKYPPELLSRNASVLFPTLPSFLGGIMDAWLDAQDVGYRAHLRTHLAYIYGHVRKVSDPSFVDSLRQSHHKAFHNLYLREDLRDKYRAPLKSMRDGHALTWAYSSNSATLQGTPNLSFCMFRPISEEGTRIISQ
jgi:hypothetical protein